MVSRNRNIFLRGAVCARTAAFLLASVLVWTHARAQAPEERYKIVNGVRTRIVVSDSASTAKADTVAITQQSLSPVKLTRRRPPDSAVNWLAWHATRRAFGTASFSGTRCRFRAYAGYRRSPPASANCITNRHGRYRFCTGPSPRQPTSASEKTASSATTSASTTR